MAACAGQTQGSSKDLFVFSHRKTTDSVLCQEEILYNFSRNPHNFPKLVYSFFTRVFHTSSCLSLGKLFVTLRFTMLRVVYTRARSNSSCLIGSILTIRNWNLSLTVPSLFRLLSQLTAFFHNLKIPSRWPSPCILGLLLRILSRNPTINVYSRRIFQLLHTKTIPKSKTLPILPVTFFQFF
jgi:hypothetical protein